MNPGQTRISLPFAALLAIAPLAVAAAEPIDGPKVKFIDPFIENLAGDWDLTRSIRGRTVKNTVKAEWVLDHHFLQLHMKDVAVPPMYEAIVLIGYSNADKEYVAHWCDVFGGRYSAVGRGKLVGDHIEFAFQYPDGPFYNTFTWNGDERTWTMKLENGAPGGQRSLFATDVLKRASP
jgi:hypothetical protein